LTISILKQRSDASIVHHVPSKRLSQKLVGETKQGKGPEKGKGRRRKNRKTKMNKKRKEKKTSNATKATKSREARDARARNFKR